MNLISKQLHRRGEQGQGLIEYALILVLVSVVSVVVLSALGVEVGESFEGLVCTFRGGNNCDVGPSGGVCANEQLIIDGHPSGLGTFACLTDYWFLLSVDTTCDGAQLSLDGYGGLDYDTNFEIYAISVPSLTGGECIGRSSAGLAPIGSYTVSSLHPDGHYKTHTLP